MSLFRLLFLVIVVGVSIGVLVCLNPAIACLPLAVPLLILFLKNATLRMLYIVFGSLFIFQSEGFGATKLAYLAGIAVVAIGSFMNIRKIIKSEKYRIFQPLLISCFIFGTYILVNIVLAVGLQGALFTSSIRDAAPYILFALTPLFALDMAIGVKKRNIKLIILTAGIIATAFFSYTWISRRGLADVNTGQLGLASFMIPAAFFSYSCAMALRGKKHRLFWSIISSLVIAGMFLTGTRSSLVFLVAALVVTWIGKKGRFIRMVRLITFGLILSVVGTFGVFSIATLTGSNLDKIQERISGISVLTNSSQLSSDASYLDRQYQTQVTLDAFKSSPIVGVGAGTGFSAFTWRTDFNFDSPFSILAKYGILGELMLVVTFIGLYKFLKRASNRGQRTMESRLALIGFVAITSLWMILGSPIEDKGFSIGLLLLLTLLNNEVLEDTKPLLNQSEKVKSVT